MTLGQLWKRLKRRRPKVEVVQSIGSPSSERTYPPGQFQPRQMHWYSFNGETWESATIENDATASAIAAWPTASTGSHELRIFTWNLQGISWSYPQTRMDTALDYLNTLIDDEREIPAIIMLQEMTSLNIEMLINASWVQERFAITDRHASFLDSTYGVTTLIDKRIPVRDVFRVKWVSRFGRDGLFVDISLPKPDYAGNSDKADKESTPIILRLCNTHLESLPSPPSDAPARPIQVRRASEFLHAKEIHGAIMAGDMNAIEEFDKSLAQDNNLKDAYLELGGEEESEEGFTWGYQTSRPIPEDHKGRLDKVFYCGALAATKIERIGVGLMVGGDDTTEDTKQIGKGTWVTDHYGLVAKFEISGMAA